MKLKPIPGFLIFFAILFSHPGLTAKTNKKTTPKVNSISNEEDLIQKAQNLILQKDRPQAIMILVKAINQTTSKNENIELRKNLEDISSLFLNDKTQQIYESTLSNKRKDIATATQKMLEISRVEPDHNLILSELARMMIIKKDCQQAYELMDAQLKKNPFDEIYNLTAAQSLACLGNKLEFDKIRTKIDFKKSNYKSEWLFLDLENYFKDGNKIKIKDTLADFKKLDPQNPSVYYFEARLQGLQKQSAQAQIEKYNQECKNLTSAQFRKYLFNPSLCLPVKE